MQGFSGDIPELAEMERHLAKKGLFDEFKNNSKTDQEPNGRPSGTPFGLKPTTLSTATPR